MMNSIIISFRFLLKHKWKISLVFLATTFFLLFLFPLGDLNDFISSKISQATNNKVFLQFDEMHLNPLTSTLGLDKVTLETEDIDHLQIDKLTATPSLFALLKKQPGGQISAEGLLGGNLNLKLSPSSAALKNADSKTETSLQKSDIELTLEKISLKEIKKTFALHFPISGTLEATATLNIDPAFIDQPEGDITASLKKFELQTSTVNLPSLGSLNLPEIKFSTVEFKGKLQGGRFLIETAKLGSPTDDFFGTLKGDVAVTIQNMNGQMIPIVNSYNLSIDLLAKSAFKDRTSILNLISDNYKTEESGSTRYKFKLVSTGPGLPPVFSPMN
jgi:type II secretion system protein N